MNSSVKLPEILGTHTFCSLGKYHQRPINIIGDIRYSKEFLEEKIMVRFEFLYLDDSFPVYQPLNFFKYKFVNNCEFRIHEVEFSATLLKPY